MKNLFLIVVVFGILILCIYAIMASNNIVEIPEGGELAYIAILTLAFWGIYFISTKLTK